MVNVQVITFDKTTNEPGKNIGHKTAKTHAGTVFCLVTLTFDLLTPKINGFPGLIVEHLYVKFGASVFEISCGETDRR